MPGPLNGIRILDLSNVVSGPMAVQILADQGADVIKIEQPGGDTSRAMGGTRAGFAALFAVLNRNKRSLVLDLQQAAAKDVFMSLVEDADVLVQNFRPGAMERLGLDYATLRAVNDRLIYTSISGFGQDGPYAKRRVYDPVIQGVTGFVSTQSGSGPDDGPQLIKNILCDKATAVTAAQAITAALFARERGQGGQSLDIAMMDAGLAFLWPDGMWNHTFLGDDVQPMPSLADIYRVTATKDGYVTFLTVSDSEWQGMCRVIEREELAQDERFADVFNRIRNIHTLIEILTEEVAKITTEDICARLDREDVPFAKINALDEIHLDPQIAHRQSLIEVEHPVAGSMRMAQPPARFSATPADIRTQAPAMGEHTDEIVREIGRSDEDIKAMRESGAIA